MAHLGKAVLQTVQQVTLRAAFEYLGDEGAVYGQGHFSDIERCTSQRHDPDMVSSSVTGRRRRHIA